MVPGESKKQMLFAITGEQRKDANNERLDGYIKKAGDYLKEIKTN